MAGLLLLMCVSTAVTLIKPLLSGAFLDCLAAEGKKGLESMVWLKHPAIRMGIWMLAASALSLVLQFANGLLLTALQTRLSFSVNRDGIAWMQKLPYDKIRQFAPTYLNSRINYDSNELSGFILRHLPQMLRELFLIGWILWMSWELEPFFLLGELIMVPAYLGLYLAVRRPLYQKDKQNKEAQNHFFSCMNEQFTLVREIKAAGTFAESLSRLQKKFEALYRTVLAYKGVAQLFQMLDDGMGLLFQAGVLAAGVMRIQEGSLSIGDFMVLNSYFVLLLQAVKYLIGFGKEYQQAKVSYDRLQEFWSWEKEPNGSVIIRELSEIRAEGIGYRYPGSGTLWIWPNLCFQKGRIYALAGKNGSGKTTLLQLMIGILQPRQGKIWLGKTESGQADWYRMRRELTAAVLQEITFPEQTLGEFLQAETEREKKEMLDWMKEEGLLAWFAPGWLGRQDWNGKELGSCSGGERQKLAITAAWKKKPQVLFLDEPTSAMDEKSVEIFCDLLKRWKETCIVILVTHEEKLLEKADVILWQENGRISLPDGDEI